MCVICLAGFYSLAVCGCEGEYCKKHIGFMLALAIGRRVFHAIVAQEKKIVIQDGACSAPTNRQFAGR